MFYVYHIPDVKVGCTSRIKNRMRELKATNWEILLETDSEEEAKRAEIKYQTEFQYKVDNESQQYNTNKFSNLDKKGYQKSLERGGIHKFTKEDNQKRFQAQYKELTCPHCGKIGMGRVMYRWHFQRCKDLNKEL